MYSSKFVGRIRSARGGRNDIDSILHFKYSQITYLSIQGMKSNNKQQWLTKIWVEFEQKLKYPSL
jgi:hypothetical protein